MSKDYYESNRCIQDYEAVLAEDLPTMYHVEHIWHNCEKIALVIQSEM